MRVFAAARRDDVQNKTVSFKAGCSLTRYGLLLSLATLIEDFYYRLFAYESIFAADSNHAANTNHR
jgi:hypothetical protein